MADTNPYPQIKAAEMHEFERLNDYLRALDADGWLEQSYCADWPVYQAVSHIGSGSRIGKMRLDAWVNGAPPATREAMMEVWGLFDSLGPENMIHEYLKAAGEYLAAEHSIPDEAGLTEVEGFRGKQPLHVYQLARLWELALHSWDVYVARDRHARLSPESASLIAAGLHNMGATIDAARAAEFKDKPVQLNVAGTPHTYTLDLTGDRPRLAAGSATGAVLVVEAPAEEMCRLVSGRHPLPGSRPELKAVQGSGEDLAKLKRVFR
ncbi:MAG TPA: maleylpyruvate isomerase N-terminal domain-containing protein [Chloroflexota bacterium]|nr:maleylpyruvate isomerase N-terminal domain-containing protein [Chloroflexota bacterium]